jgi:hypothetical protein
MIDNLPNQSRQEYCSNASINLFHLPSSASIITFQVSLSSPHAALIQMKLPPSWKSAKVGLAPNHTELLSEGYHLAMVFKPFFTALRNSSLSFDSSWAFNRSCSNFFPKLSSRVRRNHASLTGLRMKLTFTLTLFQSAVGKTRSMEDSRALWIVINHTRSLVLAWASDSELGGL